MIGALCAGLRQKYCLPHKAVFTLTLFKCYKKAVLFSSSSVKHIEDRSVEISNADKNWIHYTL